MGKRFGRKERAYLHRVLILTVLIAGWAAAGVIPHGDVQAAAGVVPHRDEASEKCSGGKVSGAKKSSQGKLPEDKNPSRGRAPEAGIPSGGRGLADGKYAVDVVLSGGSGKASVESPTLLEVKAGEYFAQITWSSSNYDYMIVEDETYYNENTEGGNSRFRIPVLAFDEEMPVIADTVAMGAPHEIQYTLHFYSDSIGSESSLPREGAKRVLIMAAFIIIAGGILNYFTNKRRKRDYLGAGR